MFKVEQLLKSLTPDKRLEQRQLKLKLLLDEFYEWIETINVLKGSKFGKAVLYAANQREGIYRVLEDGRLELSNNKAERMIKELVMGRKNWLFSTSLEGAYSSGVILSILKTAELNQLDIRKYFNYLFTEIPNLPVLNEIALEDFLPWSDQVVENCR